MDPLPRYSLAANFLNQPSIPGVGRLLLCPMDAIGTTTEPRWQEDQVFADYLGYCEEGAYTHIILDRETSTPELDLPLLTRMSARFIEAGIQPWWYTPALIDDTNICAELRNTDPARYKRWLNRLMGINLPRGCNVSFDIYRSDFFSSNYAARIIETARGMRLAFPDKRILPLVFHRRQSVAAPHIGELQPLDLWRSQIQLAILLHGRCAWWFDKPETQQPWNPADPHTRVFLEEAA